MPCLLHNLMEQKLFRWKVFSLAGRCSVICIRENVNAEGMCKDEVHILRLLDSWTKLNVSPAKIMQVCMNFYVWCATFRNST